MKFMKDLDFRRGKPLAMCILQSGRIIRCVVLGNDFTVLRYEKDLDCFPQTHQEPNGVPAQGETWTRA